MEDNILKYLDKAGKIQKTGIKNILPILLSESTPNTYALANNLEKKYKNKEYARQYIARRLADPKMNSGILTNLCRFHLNELEEIDIIMDQTELGNNFAILSVSYRFHNRSLPMDWEIEEGKANIGFAKQKLMLDRIACILGVEKKVTLFADRFYSSTELIKYCKKKGWDYRIRLKNNIEIDTGVCCGKTGDIENYPNHFIDNVLLFEERIKTNIGYIKEAGHDDGWIIAMGSIASRQSTLEYKKRWGTECMFKDFKSGGFNLEDTQIKSRQRINGLYAFLALGIYWSVHISTHLKKD